MEQADRWASLRREYGASGLSEDHLDADPFVMFDRWYDDAVAAGLPEPNAMIVATVSPSGRPAARTVLLKGVSRQGFRFFTNTASRKGRDLSSNPAVALLFPWHPLERQVRVEGTATRLDEATVADYFASRPRAAQLGAWASHQSSVVAGRDELMAAYAEAEARFAGQDVPVPPDWGGYVVRPDSIELWQGRPGRLHDRLVYHLNLRGEWTVSRLAP